VWRYWISNYQLVLAPISLTVGLRILSSQWLKNSLWYHVALLTVWTLEYSFLCSVLSNNTRADNSIRYLKLGFCAFHPTAELGPLRNLAILSLHHVNVTDDELECFLSKCHALEQLNVKDCMRIICLKIPRALQKLSCLTVSECWSLQVIESKAENLSSLHFNRNVKLSLAGPLQMKRLSILRGIQWLSIMLILSFRPLCQILRPFI
jgi:hypothetical protein